MAGDEAGASTSPVAPRGAGIGANELVLYMLVILVWGTSWFGMRLQTGVVAPEMSVLWRFVLATPLMFAWARAAGQPLSFGASAHLRFAGMGLTMCSANLVMFYHASMMIPSGLMAVVFSLSSIFNVLLGAVFLGQAIERRIVSAGLIGVAGVALMFSPELTGHTIDRRAVLGLSLSVIATLCFCSGSIISAAAQRARLPVLSSMAWAMLYGVAILAAVSIISGHAFIIEPSLRYISVLIWLAAVSTVIAFAAFLTLVGRIGAPRAGYMTILFPVVALAVSTVFEGYRWTAPAFLGLSLVIAGNVLALRRPR